MSAESWPPGFAEPDTGKLPLTIRQPVAWGDMDSMGHVNNAVYLRWLENVRFDLFERMGVSRLHREEGKGPILARVSVDFLSPVTFPDKLLVSARVTALGNKSFTLRNEVWSLARGALCARAEAVIVMVDYGSVCTIAVPAPIRAALQVHLVAE
jgi:acyl-CoA thioester hydrolase